MEDKAVKKMMAKRTTQNYFLLGIIILLVVVVVILSLLNRGEETLTVKVQGEEVASFSMVDLEALNPEEFVQVLQSGGMEPVESTYTGVPLARVLTVASSDYFPGSELATAMAADGHAVSFDTDEVNQPGHIYVVWKQDGEALGNEIQGGSGPFMIIPRQDEFGQRWVKFLIEVDIE